MQQIRAQVHAPAAHIELVTSIVTVAGVRVRATADLALLVGGRDDPSLTDRWLVDSVPHLVVRWGARAIRVGPFVQPGVTACVRCMTIGAASPARALVAVASPDPAGTDGPDPALLTAALGCAVRDLATWREGGVPITWSASLMVFSDRSPELARWPRHPHCGCSWGPLDHRSLEQRRHRLG